MFHFKPEKLNTLKPLRTGRFSTIYPYQKDPTDKRWMVRTLMLQNFDEVKCYNDEIIPSIDCIHPFIHTIVGSYIQKNDMNESIMVHLKMPRPTSNLETFIDNLQIHQSKVFPSEEQIIKWFYGICSALDYLQSKDVIHGKVNPENLVFDNGGNLLLSEIGFSQLDMDDSCVVCPSKEKYTAPECQDYKFYKKPITQNDVFKADAWSLGMSILNLCLARNEKKNLNISESKLWLHDINDSIFEIKETYSLELSEALANLLNLDPDKRSNFKDTCRALEKEFPDILVNITE